ncbi:immunoglobulin light [Labeo rohita]|nr:immunoglobulin light [Labeo rohita]
MVSSGVTRPKLSVLPPSSAEISSKKTATLVCVANKGFPSDWSLSWKVDGSSRSQESSAGLLEKDGVTRPKLSVLPPSSAEISSKKTATLVCVANKGFPSDWSLSWKVDGSSRSQESSAGLLEEDGVTRPKLSVLPPSSAEISSKKTATLVCVANKGFPSDWSLSWKVDGSSRSQESSAGLLEKDGVTRPKLSVLPPSSAEISSKKTATLVCVANKGFTSDWSLSWKVDGSSRSQESSAGLLEKDGLYSWSSSLTLSEQEWMESVSVSCEATRRGQPALTGHVTRHQCSE